MSDKLNWVKVNVASMPEAMRKKYDAAIAARKVANEAWDAFQKDFKAKAAKDGKVPAGKELVLSAKWGSLSVAVTEPKATKTADSGTGFTF